MPKKRKHELVVGQHFQWKLWNRDGVYQADGRSNPANAGRHSLGEQDRDEALKALKQLDLVMAVELGLADKAALGETGKEPLDLEKGRDLYKQSVLAPRVAGGASKETWKRYRPVFEKFFAFARKNGVTEWSQVTKRLLQSYAACLDEEGYADRTIYLELTTIKQTVGYLVAEKHLPEGHRIVMPLEKPADSPTYCYSKREVEAIVAFCGARSELAWLGQICTALACTGLRIGELSSLRWQDVDLVRNIILISNDPSSRNGEKRRRTKNRKDRRLPISAELLPVLQRLPRYQDGRVFHGPREGTLKADTVRNILTEKVLCHVRGILEQQEGQTEIERGRLHSFRHFFCSECANRNIPIQMVMDWLGHQDSRMIKYYYHLSDERAQAEMKRISFVGDTGQETCRPTDNAGKAEAADRRAVVCK